MIILEYIIVKYFLRKSKGFLIKSEKRKTHSYNRQKSAQLIAGE